MSSSYGPPYILVGWAGGAPTAYRFAASSPDLVDSVVLVDAGRSTSDVAWIRARALDWTEKDREAYFFAQVRDRLKAASEHNAMVVPFGVGLMLDIYYGEV